MDTDHDGTLNYKEIKAAEGLLRNQFKLGDKWEEVMKKCDLDGDGNIDF